MQQLLHPLKPWPPHPCHRPRHWKPLEFTVTILHLQTPLLHWRKRHCQRLLPSHLPTVHVCSNLALGGLPLPLLRTLPTLPTIITSCLCNRRDSPILKIIITEVGQRLTKSNRKGLDTHMFIQLLSINRHLGVRMGTHFLRILIRMTISMFHRSSRIKTTIETIPLCLSLLVILSHTSHIHNRRINRQVRALLHQHLPIHTIPEPPDLRHRRCLHIQHSMTTTILTSSSIHIMAMGW